MNDLETHDLDDALQWLKNVSGVDDRYIAQWPRAAWEQWARAMYTYPNEYPNEANPSVPDWMQPHLGSWQGDFSAPYPCVAQLLPTAHDWFAEAVTREDFTLGDAELTGDALADSATPTVEQLHQAWKLAKDSGATPLISLSIVPAEPYGHAVVGEIEAFYVVGNPLRHELLQGITELLGVEGAARSVLKSDANEMLTLAGREPVNGAELHTWEWMYG